MERVETTAIIKKLSQQLQAISYDSLPISSYNKEYIGRVLPAMEYYLRIYFLCLQRGLDSSGINYRELTLVDFGGGSGFLSMLAKAMGVGKVIYVDINPLSVHTATILKEQTGIGADVMIEGSTNELREWCSANSQKPELLIATDLIEHVYNLEDFFAGLIRTNPSMHMIFTTASTPFNPYVKRKLRKIMVSCEAGKGESPNYLTRRKRYIKTEFPELSDPETEIWSRSTRGLIYKDICRHIQAGIMPHPTDLWNTCDPETGNWTERILPIASYRNLLHPYAYKIELEKGFYNEQRTLAPVAMLCRFLNYLILRTDEWGYKLSPFILLHCKPLNSKN